MKRIYRLLPIVLVLLTIVSCKHFISAPTGSIAVTMPDIPGAVASGAREVTNPPETPDTVEYTFKIILTDSTGAKQERLADPGDAVLFDALPLGPASVQVIAYQVNENGPNPACYSGKTTVDVVEGENTAAVAMNAIKVRLRYPEGGTYKTLYVKDGLSDTDFTQPVYMQFEVTIPGTEGEGWSTPTTSETYPMYFVDFYDRNIGKSFDFSADGVLDSFVSELTGDKDIFVREGVRLNDLGEYLKSDEIYEGVEVIVLNDSSATITQIPQYSSSDRKATATNLTLDFSRCTQLTSVNSGAFASNTDRWVKVLKLPPSITTINGIRGVTEAVYISNPSSAVTFSSNVSYGTGESGTSTYDVHFGGTLADWCSKTTLPNTTDSHPFTGDGRFFVLDSDGNEYCASTGNLVVENTTTSIGANSFKGLKCTSITIPGDVSTIGQYAFENCTQLRDVWLLRTSNCVTITDTTFTGCSGVKVHVPSNLVESYNDAGRQAKWAKFISAGTVTIVGF